LFEARIRKQGISTMMSIVPRMRWNNLQDQQSTNKENIPPTIPTQAKNPIKVNKVPNLTQWGRWTSDVLEATMDVVERGQLSLKKASKFWHILSHPFQITWMGRQNQESKGHKVCSQSRRMKHLWLGVLECKNADFQSPYISSKWK
jgi:hypothetical protein